MEKRFAVEFLEEAIVFIDSMDEKAREKVIYNIRKAQIVNDKELFKKLNEDIWEFRTLFNKTHYRLYAFWVKTSNQAEKLVISTHGHIKKTKKTPRQEMERVIRIKDNYFKHKK
jgi:phage-related protein